MDTERREFLRAGAGLTFGAGLGGCAMTAPREAGESEWRSFKAADGAEIHFRLWRAASPRATVQIVHGAAEHSGRYDRFARALTRQGYAVYATDHRGHGRTRVRSGQLGDAGPDAWNRFVEDERQLRQLVRGENPGAKVILFGHSLGSFIAQDDLTRGPALPDAVVLSGTAYRPAPPKELIAALDTAAQKAPLGASEFWANLFKDFNRPFSAQPGFEWLSRDPAEVQKYVQDPLCGFDFNNELVRDIFKGFAAFRDPAREARVATGIPILVIQGSLDPVGANLKATEALLDRYRALGLTRVSHRFYEGARHELLNETNRDQVTRDVLDWLASVR